MTYNFYTFSGQLLETRETNDPVQYANELAHFHGVDADEVEFETPEEALKYQEEPEND